MKLQRRDHRSAAGRSALRIPRLIVPRLLAWFAANARDLPWRRTRDPYAIWVSEIMLQQTQVKTVIPYWERWMREFPNIQSLAKAKPQKIHKLWEGLGYYTRVRNMQKAAQVICSEHHGRFPTDFEDILALPGIGRYTAGAIASIAFNQPAPILDGNVIRVLTRLHGIGADPHESKTNIQLWSLAEELVQVAHSTQHATRNTHPNPKLKTRSSKSKAHACSQLNQSLMELGALICTPSSPNCEACPIASSCVALREDRISELPRAKERATITNRRYIALILERDGRFLVQQRKAGVVNAHLWEFPNYEAETNATAAGTTWKHLGLKPETVDKLCVIRHAITRFRITTEAYRLRLGASSATTVQLPGVWRTRAQLQSLPFTSAHRRIERQLKIVKPAP